MNAAVRQFHTYSDISRRAGRAGYAFICVRLAGGVTQVVSHGSGLLDTYNTCEAEVAAIRLALETLGDNCGVVAHSDLADIEKLAAGRLSHGKTFKYPDATIKLRNELDRTDGVVVFDFPGERSTYYQSCHHIARHHTLAMMRHEGLALDPGKWHRWPD